MSIPIWQADSFTSEPFRGNPAAVCILSGFPSDTWMQAVAAEMNLSETAFLVADGDSYRLRWFTPVAEVELCGHATLASAHVLWESGTAHADRRIRFKTMSGELAANRHDDLIELDFPARPPREAEPPPGLVDTLGVEPQWIGRNTEDYIVVLADEGAVRATAPDFAALRRVTALGVMVTAPAAGGDHDFVSRFFAPAIGIDEDPVTGAAHCCLAPYWARRLGTDRLRGFQASARGGTVHVRLAGDRVVLGGHAVTTLRGEMLVAPDRVEA
jgi:PhzF family phenazine biosynthesis protein